MKFEVELFKLFYRIFLTKFFSISSHDVISIFDWIELELNKKVEFPVDLELNLSQLRKILSIFQRKLIRFIWFNTCKKFGQFFIKFWAEFGQFWPIFEWISDQKWVDARNLVNFSLNLANFGRFSRKFLINLM